VGTHVNIRHLRPAPKGAEIRVVAKLIKQGDRKLIFEVKAYWKEEMIGEGTHERYIVDKEKFLRKLKEKIGA
ncbi:MAG: thioesterase family protein, partial [Candidatus Njordarchaeota archaeon]